MPTFNLPNFDIWNWTSHAIGMWNELAGLTHGIQIFVLVATIVGGIVLLFRVIRSFGRDDDNNPRVSVNVARPRQRTFRSSRRRRR